MNVNVIQEVTQLLQAGKDAEATEAWASALSAEPVCDIRASIVALVAAVDATLGRQALRTTRLGRFEHLLIHDIRYQDAIHRNAMWKNWWGKASAEPTSVSPDTMTIARDAAAWRSSPWPRDAITPPQTLGGHAYLREDGGVAIELLDGPGREDGGRRPAVHADGWPEDLAVLVEQAKAAGDTLLVLLPPP